MPRLSQLSRSIASKVAIVTGAASGMGRATAHLFADEGAHVAVVDQNGDGVSKVTDEISAAGGSAAGWALDISDTVVLAKMVTEVVEKFGGLDILINNAGIASVGNVEACTPEEMDRIYEVNVKGMYHCLHFAVPKMIKGGGGCVVNLASVASYLGISDRFAYSMSKGAVLSMTMSIARDYIDRGIRCKCVCPGRVHTPFVDGYLAKNYSEEERPKMFKTLSEWQPIGRMGTPAEIAGLVAYLTSEQAGFITGSAFEIDGGVTNLR